MEEVSLNMVERLRRNRPYLMQLKDHVGLVELSAFNDAITCKSDVESQSEVVDMV